MVVARHLGPAFSCVVDLIGRVVDLAPNLAFQHRCMMKAEEGGDVRATRRLDRIRLALRACSCPARWAIRGQRFSSPSTLADSSPPPPHLPTAMRCRRATAKQPSGDRSFLAFCLQASRYRGRSEPTTDRAM